MNLTTEEKIIESVFRDRYKIDLMKIKESNKKAPDFEGRIDKKLQFYMELKTIDRDEFTDGGVIQRDWPQ